MTSRATAIAERIREKFKSKPGCDCRCNDDMYRSTVNEVACGIERDKIIDDLLGPEPTTEVLEWLRDAQEECWSDARSFARAGRTSRNPRGSFDECMKYRRLAKWMRNLERSLR